MTPEQKEIRDAEQKVFADVRKIRRQIAKETKSLSPAELKEYYRNCVERVKAMGYRVVISKEEKSGGIGND